MSDVTRRAASSEAAEPADADNVLRPYGDIYEHEGGITLVLDMPGVSRDRLEIHSDRNDLVVEGSVAVDVPKGTEAVYADVRATRYRRSFSLSGEQLDTDAVAASLKDGVLRIDIPKRPELKPRRIEVHTG